MPIDTSILEVLRRPPDSALVVTDGGDVVVARLGAFGGVARVERFAADALGATEIAPGDCYVDVAGRRHWVTGVWTYSLYRLHAGRVAGARRQRVRARRRGPVLTVPLGWRPGRR